VLCPAALALLFSQAADPAALAYEALRAREYDRAIVLFREAVAAQPDRPALHKDLAYTWLRTGETAAARDQFAEAVRLDPNDRQAALEYAFLCNETGRRAEARRIFDRLRKEGDSTAETAFQNIDRPLAEGIARWSAVVERSPENYSARRELARLAEERGELELAAENYLAAWRLKREDRDLLVDLGRIRLAQKRPEDANAALLAASRGSTPRASDSARELLPDRYPYVNEFRRALELDPENAELRRELAFLLLAMDKQPDAEAEFRLILKTAPADRLAAAQLGFLLLGRGERAEALPLLRGVLAGPSDELSARVRAMLDASAERKLERRPQTHLTAPAGSPKELGSRSYDAGMLPDALKYFTTAHKEDPLDFSVILKLGWTENMLKNDRKALGWFRLASRSPDPKIAGEAARAVGNLRPAQARFRTTVWAFPFWSSRWRDVFSYAQVKTEARIGRLPFRPYVSLRFIGDAQGVMGETAPQNLSESAIVAAAGIAMPAWKGLTLWGEAGEAMSYRRQTGGVVPDYRGGISFFRGIGTPLNGESGWFADTADDAVFLSRFGNDVLFYSQNRVGFTLPPLRDFQLQLFTGANFSTDAKHQYWANIAEFGPGVRFRFTWLPAVFSVNLMRGAYVCEQNDPSGPKFTDVRVGLWYAFTR